MSFKTENLWFIEKPILGGSIFFAGNDGKQKPTWTTDVKMAKPFTNKWDALRERSMFSSVDFPGTKVSQIAVPVVEYDKRTEQN